jgi:hypothetical protein
VGSATKELFNLRRGTVLLSKIVRLRSVNLQSHIHCEHGANPSGVKCPGLETDNSFPPNAAVKNGWSHTSTPPYLSS